MLAERSDLLAEKKGASVRAKTAELAFAKEKECRRKKIKRSIRAGGRSERGETL